MSGLVDLIGAQFRIGATASAHGGVHWAATTDMSMMEGVDAGREKEGD